ncbi:MAG TPA: amino acid adenylation domain-containing protein, partial [Acidimicrobiales bacterium]|nr:amino acid adenylation domain-containing protein [Acidimicrobiales bacterium]
LAKSCDAGPFWVDEVTDVRSCAAVHRAILEHATADPERAAVKDLGRDLSYADLCDEAGRLAAGLVARGVRDGDRVVLHLPNSVDFAVAALACLWVGATFVPLSVTDPVARLAGILDDCDPVLALTVATGDDGPAASLALGRFPWVSMAELLSIGAEVPDPVDGSNRVAYAIYTSGTTGKPKGVMIGNGAFLAAVRATVSALSLGTETRTLCVSPFHFDGSFGTLFPTLFAGGAVVIRPRESLLYPRTFFNAVIQESVTYTGFSPTYLRLLLSSPQVSKLASSTLLVALGGEASSAADIRALWAAAPQVQVYNRYGPTETTIAVTHIEVTADLIEDGTVPIGQPHPGVDFYLVDDRGQVIDQPGRVGELFIGGSQLMAGYWGAPELTKQVLSTDIVPGQTLYKTGDLVYRDITGDYVYVDRADRVIKRSGVRISLIEMGESMSKLPGVSSAACLTFDDDGDLGIVAFVVVDSGVTAFDLQRAARQVLPETMLPNRIQIVDSLPLTPSSKLDERSLLAQAGLHELGLARTA